MGGRNNKLCDQRGQDPKGCQAGKETTKRNPAAGQNKIRGFDANWVFVLLIAEVFCCWDPKLKKLQLGILLHEFTVRVWLFRTSNNPKHNKRSFNCCFRFLAEYFYKILLICLQKF